MKIIGLMIASDRDDDILPETLLRASWMDRVIVIDDGGDFDESRLVPKLHELAKNENADWYIDIDADEFWPDMRGQLSEVPEDINIASVNILSVVRDQVYDVKPDWRRCYRNRPELFDYSHIKKLHHGKIPMAGEAHKTNQDVLHYSIRSYEQGMAKYENYKQIDTTGEQVTYEHIRRISECYKTGDFSGLRNYGSITSKV